MQAVIVCASFFILLVQSSWGGIPKNAALDRIDHQCLNDLNIPQQTVADAFQEDYTLVEGSENVNKYLACVWKTRGYLIENGDLNVAKIQHWVKYSLLETIEATELAGQDVVLPAIISDCESEVKARGDGPGDVAVKMYNCIVGRIWNLA